MARTTYRPPARRFQDVANGPELTRAVRLIAERGKVYAKSISPRSGDLDDLPYAESFEVQVIQVRLLTRRGYSPRVAARLFNKAGHAAAVEWGNRRNGGNGQRVLGRTLEALGGLGG